MAETLLLWFNRFTDDPSKVQSRLSGRPVLMYEPPEQAEAPDDETDPPDRFGELGRPLRAKVWNFALQAARHVRFRVPTDERQFAARAAQVVYPLVEVAGRDPVMVAQFLGGLGREPEGPGIHGRLAQGRPLYSCR